MKPKLLVILGSTSTGKTDLGLELAKKFNGELISADSRQVYKYLDIGTGKMPGNESGMMNQVSREGGYWIVDGIRVWMYDLVDPKIRFNLYQFIINAGAVIKDIIFRDKLPILTGGTGLYIRSLLEGVSDFGIDQDSKLRKELEMLGIKQIRAKINKISPIALNKLNNSELNNKRRLIRLLEKLTNTKNSDSFDGLEKDFDILKIGLRVERNLLRSRIKQRILSRIDQGMIEESKNLLSKRILTYKRMNELGLEYKYISKFLKGEIKSLEELIEILSLKIGQYAKRQETWFKKEKNMVWFNIGDNDFIKKVEKQVQDWYNDL